MNRSFVLSLLSLSLVVVGFATTTAAHAQTVPTCNGLTATAYAPSIEPWTFVGTDADDVIVGGPGPDVIEGLGGNDTICGMGGFDQINGGLGRDWIDGGRGTDIVEGGRGPDVLYGGPGDDVLSGNPGNDKMFGQTGRDELWGGKGNDRLVGGPGRDSIVGSLGLRDLMIGGGGIDRCNDLAARARGCEVLNDGCPRILPGTCNAAALKRYSWVLLPG